MEGGSDIAPTFKCIADAPNMNQDSASALLISCLKCFQKCILVQCLGEKKAKVHRYYYVLAKTNDHNLHSQVSSGTKTLHLNGSLWELGGGSRFSCK